MCTIVAGSRVRAHNSSAMKEGDVVSFANRSCGISSHEADGHKLAYIVWDGEERAREIAICTSQLTEV